jgi:nucleotide-binding universal stress UspA family protein
MTAAEYRIVVGVDGSADARAGLRWAMDHAVTHPKAHVTLVHAWSLPDAAGMMSKEGFEIRRAAAQRVLSDAVQSTRPADGTTVTVRLEYGAAAAAVLSNAEDTDLIVVGTRGRGPVSGLLLGSVSQAVVSRATAPVAVISHAMPSDRGAIVVGLDDSPEARSALRWAATDAQRQGLPLKVVHAFQPHHVAGLFGMAKLQPDVAWRADAIRALAAILHEEIGDPGGLELDAVATQAGPAVGLLGAAEGASLIVLGTRGRGGAASALLGSVSSEVLKRPPCPVVLIPPAHATPRPARTVMSEVVS